MVTSPQDLNSLKDLGFVHIGHWDIENGEQVRACINDEYDVVYAFVSDRVVFYIGVTSKALKVRLRGHHKREKIYELLKDNKPVDVYTLSSRKIKEMVENNSLRGMVLNYASGVEKSLINTFTPPWNDTFNTAIERAVNELLADILDK